MSDNAYEALVQEIERIVNCPYPMQLKVLICEHCCSRLDTDQRIGFARSAMPAMYHRRHLPMGDIEAMSNCEGCRVRIGGVAEMAIRP